MQEWWQHCKCQYTLLLLGLSCSSSVLSHLCSEWRYWWQCLANCWLHCRFLCNLVKSDIFDYFTFLFILRTTSKIFIPAAEGSVIQALTGVRSVDKVETEAGSVDAPEYTDVHADAVGSVKQALTAVTSVDRVETDPNWLGMDVDALK